MRTTSARSRRGKQSAATMYWKRWKRLSYLSFSSLLRPLLPVSPLLLHLCTYLRSAFFVRKNCKMAFCHFLVSLPYMIHWWTSIIPFTNPESLCFVFFFRPNKKWQWEIYSIFLWLRLLGWWMLCKLMVRYEFEMLNCFKFGI